MIQSFENFKENIISEISGLIAFSVTEIATGASYVHHSNDENFDVETEASFNLEVLKAKVRAVKSLGLSERILDIVTTFENQIHIIDVSEDASYFIYLAIDSKYGNLLITRSLLSKFKQNLVVEF